MPPNQRYGLRLGGERGVVIRLFIVVTVSIFLFLLILGVSPTDELD